MSNRLHSHYFRGFTSLNDGHEHRYYGSTSQDPDIPGHMHTLIGETTFADGHIHLYSLYSSPPIQVENGHIHYYQAETSLNDGHIHYLNGDTSVDYDG